jgi:iron complex outermembrane recepter protein
MMQHRHLLFGLVSLAWYSFAVASEAPATIGEVVVTGARQAQPLLEVAESVTRVDADTIAARGATHYSQLIDAVAGAFFQRGSGQEGLLALRSPVFSGAGACGAFLLLEDGAPLRPPGFCNLNELFEVNTEQAAAVEVLRGPGSALYGAGAQHGSVQVIGADPESLRPIEVAVEAGQDNYRRIKLASKFSPSLGAYLLATHDGGWRVDSRVDELKANLRYAQRFDNGRLSASLAATALDQETAGFIEGFDAYRDSALRQSNANPEAFRNAHSVRANVAWIQNLHDGSNFESRAILRWSDMDFLQHFLLGKPLERNGQRSLGLQFKWDKTLGPINFALGSDIDFAHSFLIENQLGPTTGGTPAARAIRPQGLHYDYTVNTQAVGLYARGEWRFADAWIASAGVRGDRIEYRYDNRMRDGNTDANGVACGPRGCLFNRPADRSDRFSVFSPQLSLLFRSSDRSSVYLTASRGFRPPESSELYRLQRQQSSADLTAERLDMLELGMRYVGTNWSLAGAAYTGRKKQFIFRDAGGFNVDNGRSTHRGVEVEFGLRPSAAWSLRGSLSYARHRYDFTQLTDGGESVVTGNEIDTAPKKLANLEASYRFSNDWSAALQWNYVGPYFADAANSARYPGHSVASARLSARLAPRWSATVRAENIFDRAYADRADFAFGNYRYFPGRERSFFVELRYRAD